MKVKRNIIRTVLQWGLFIYLTALWTKVLVVRGSFVDFEACCPMGGLQSLVTFISNGSLACTMEGMQLVMGAILAVACILFSKLFCGYLCPIGTFTEGLGKIGQRLKLPQYSVNGIVDITLRSIKYILLFTTFYFTLQSNDLFCKTFDPYYAVATGYGEETNTLYATIAIVMVVFGAIFLRQFWCRYVCPLGALSNMFKYFYVFIAVAVVGVVLAQIDIEAAKEILLGLACVLGYIFEIVGLRKKAGVQVVKVVRHPHTCIDCGLCAKNCPQGIQVDQMTSVNHPDCNLCTECVTICPKKGAIGINGSSKFTWLPAAITIGLVMVGLVLGSKMEIPTVDMNWGNDIQNAQSGVVEMKGIKNVKCYGSSIAFVNRMQAVKGVLGVKTYVGEHHVVLDYDTTMMTAEQVKSKIFIPTDLEINEPSDAAQVYLYDLKVENYFDEMDRVFIANTFKDMKSVYGLKTFYGNPIKIRILGDSTLTADSIASIIEGCDLVYSTPEKTFSSKGLYKVTEAIQNDTVYSGLYLKSLSFKSFRTGFNNRKDYANEELAVLTLPILSYTKNQQRMQYVANYLSKANANIVGLSAQYTVNGPQVTLIYVKDKINIEDLKAYMAKDTIEVHYSNGTTKTMKMPYKFDTK